MTTNMQELTVICRDPRDDGRDSGVLVYLVNVPAADAKNYDVLREHIVAQRIYDADIEDDDHNREEMRENTHVLLAFAGDIPNFVDFRSC